MRNVFMCVGGMLLLTAGLAANAQSSSHTITYAGQDSSITWAVPFTLNGSSLATAWRSNIPKTQVSGVSDSMVSSNVAAGSAAYEPNNLGAAFYNGGGSGTPYSVADNSFGRTGHNLVVGINPRTGGGNLTPFNSAPEGSTMSLFAFGLTPLFGAFWSKRRNKSNKHPVT
jgi:hypothetical protein